MHEVRELLVFSRPGCHLCEDLIEELEHLCRAAQVGLRVLDVDTRADWQLRYGERIPVVCAGTEELSGWPFDRARILEWLGPG